MSIKMRVLGLGVLLAGFLLGGSVSAVRADTVGPGSATGTDPFIFNFDENGNGSINVNNTGFVTLNGSLMADPTNGGALALTFLLPTGVLVGNGAIEVIDATGGLSDALVFTNASGDVHVGDQSADRIIYYSTKDGDSLADTGFPEGFTSPSTVTETGTEGAVTEFTIGGPGDNQYNGISDSPVPEPGTLLLLGSGLLSVVGFARKKNWLQ